ncbi:hypothetical protein BJV77DRAFT_1006240 [Russula vinacea]|nr:hypothetical protein BJV77DRAFT_1006240 [Russula vinacea]
MGKSPKSTPQSRHLVRLSVFFTRTRSPSIATPPSCQMYVNYRAFTDSFLTPTHACLLSCALDTAVLNTCAYAFNTHADAFNTHADVFNTHTCAFDTATLDTHAYIFNTRTYAFNVQHPQVHVQYPHVCVQHLHIFVQHPCICVEVQVQCAKGGGMGH